MSGARAERLARIVAGVVRQALRDAGAEGIVLLDADSPEGGLARAWLEPVAPLRASATSGRELLAHPANKTALLLAAVPRADLFPLGDLYASEVAELAGAWSAPEPVAALVGSGADVASIDAALRRWAEGRENLEAAVRGLPENTARALADALAAGRFARRQCGLVPKLGGRTLGIDLWE